MADIATRNERVVLTLEDSGFTTGMARAAAASALLSKELNSLSGQSVSSRGIDRVSRDMEKVGKSADRSGPAIDRFSGRLTLIRDVALTIGPAFIPIGAVAVPAMTGLAAQMGAAAIAGAAIIGAFQGMGGALEAVNKAALEPTTENLQAAAIAMGDLSPAARDLVGQLQDFRPALLELRDAVGAGLFPGVGQALEDLEGALPAVERLLFSVGDAAGTLAEEFGAGISGARGQEFLDFLAIEAPRALLDLGRTLGNLTGGLAELWMAFTPLNNDFSDWMLDASQSFDEWAQGLSQTEGFNDFIEYIRTAGPQVADAMGAIGNAILQIVEAAAPLGGPTLAALEAVADVIAAIADSSVGPALFAIASGLVLVNRAMAIFAAIKAAPVFAAIASTSAGAAGGMTTLNKAAAGAALGLAGAVLAYKALQDALADDMPTPEVLSGKLFDLSNGDIESVGEEFDSLSDSIRRIADPYIAESIFDIGLGLAGLETGNMGDATDDVETLDAALVDMVNTFGTVAAEDGFDSLVKDLGLTSEEVEKLRGLLPGFEGALASVANEEKAAAAAAEAVADGFKLAESAAETFQRAVMKLNDVLEGRANVRDYEAALDDFAKAANKIKDPSKLFGKNGQFNVDLPKARELESQFDAIASSAIEIAKGMERTERTAFLTQARRDMIDALQKLGLTRKEAARLADQLGLLDNIKANPQITADTARAESNVRDLLNALAQVRDRTVTVTTVFTESGRRFKDFDTGGYTGAGHYLEPRGIVHAGEVVIPKWLVQRDWNLLKARYGHLPGFSGGGVVGVQRTASPTVNVSAPSAPNVSVGGAAVRVFIDGAEVRAVVRSEQASDDRFSRILEDR